MEIAALAGGVGASKLLLGLSRTIDPGELTVIVNTEDEIMTSCCTGFQYRPTWISSHTL